MRGYLSRGGLGLCLGVLLLAAALAGVQSACLRGGTACPAGRSAGDVRAAGPFLLEVEQSRVEAGRAYVVLHLWRPEGPVERGRRVRIDGVAALRTHHPACPTTTWRPVESQWLIRNELATIPPGETLVHPVLGSVPATRHAGEARGIFAFEWDGPADSPHSAAGFAFTLPGGATASFPITIKEIQ